MADHKDTESSQVVYSSANPIHQNPTKILEIEPRDSELETEIMPGISASFMMQDHSFSENPASTAPPPPPSYPPPPSHPSAPFHPPPPPQQRAPHLAHTKPIMHHINPSQQQAMHVSPQHAETAPLVRSVMELQKGKLEEPEVRNKEQVASVVDTSSLSVLHKSIKSKKRSRVLLPLWIALGVFASIGAVYIAFLEPTLPGLSVVLLVTLITCLLGLQAYRHFVRGLLIYLGKRRGLAAWEKAAAQMDFTFSEHDTHEILERYHTEFSTFNRFSHRDQINHTLSGEVGEHKFHIVDLRRVMLGKKHIEGSRAKILPDTFYEETICITEKNGVSFPYMMLRPNRGPALSFFSAKRYASLKGEVQAGQLQQIVFDDDAFSKAYILTGADEASLRKLFTTEVRRYLLGLKGLDVHLEAYGGTLMLHHKMFLKPSDAKALISETQQIVAAFEPLLSSSSNEEPSPRRLKASPSRAQKVKKRRMNRAFVMWLVLLTFVLVAVLLHTFRG